MVFLSAPRVFPEARGSGANNSAGIVDAAGNAARYHAAFEIARRLDGSALAAQTLLSGIDGNTSLAPAMKVLLERIPVGGVMLFKYNLDSPKAEVKKLLAETSGLVAAKAGVAPFMAVDHEGGLVHRFGPGVERLPSAFSFWELAEREGSDAALARAEILYRMALKPTGGIMICGKEGYGSSRFSRPCSCSRRVTTVQQMTAVADSRGNGLIRMFSLRATPIFRMRLAALGCVHTT